MEYTLWMLFLASPYFLHDAGFCVSALQFCGPFNSVNHFSIIPGKRATAVSRLASYINSWMFIGKLTYLTWISIGISILGLPHTPRCAQKTIQKRSDFWCPKWSWLHDHLVRRCALTPESFPMALESRPVRLQWPFPSSPARFLEKKNVLLTSPPAKKKVLQVLVEWWKIPPIHRMCDMNWCRICPATEVLKKIMIDDDNLGTLWYSTGLWM